MNEYFDDIGLGSYYERRSEEDLKEWNRFKDMRTDHSMDESWIEENKKQGESKDDTNQSK